MAAKPMPGGIGHTKEATEEIQDLCRQVKALVEKKVNRTFDEFVATSYVSQVVAGVNYFVKISIGSNEHLHVRIYKPLQGEMQVHSVQEGKTKDDAITYF